MVDKEERDGEYAKNIKVIWWIKSLLASYIVTGILLLVLTFFMYKFELNEKIVSAAIVGIYVVSTLIGGMIIGKLTKSKRYLWGMVLGIIYFVLLLLITLGVYRTLNGDSVSIVTSLILCAGGGMTGGMIS
ncbi:MAG: TIGR04086 family membrane protein [Dorea formicigenerans]